MRLGNVSLDGSTTRLIAAARATAACEDLPKESARQLLASARALRLYLEAGQSVLAIGQLVFIENLTSELGEAGDEVLRGAYERLTGDVRRSLARWTAA